MKVNDYEPHNYHYTIDSYEFPDDKSEWRNCPKCGLKPKVWVWDNGRKTACGCWESKYDAFEIRAKSIGDHLREHGDLCNYDNDKLKKNWNEWVDQYESK